MSTTDNRLNEQTTVVGIFATRDEANNAISDLYKLGFTDQQIGFIVRDAEGTAQGEVTPSEAGTAQSATVGAVSGGVLGGIVGAASVLLIPGLGPALAGGILAATLGGAAVGAVAGGLIGALTRLGIPEEQARYYQNEFEAGRIIVTVYAPGKQPEALAVMRRNGAYDATMQHQPQPRGEQPPYVGATAGAYDQPGSYNTAQDQPGSYSQHYGSDVTRSDPNNPEMPPRSYDPDDPNAQRRSYDPNDPSAQRRSYDTDRQRNYDPNDPNMQRRSYDPNDPNAQRSYDVDRRRSYDPNDPNQ